MSLVQDLNDTIEEAIAKPEYSDVKALRKSEIAVMDSIDKAVSNLQMERSEIVLTDQKLARVIDYAINELKSKRSYIMSQYKKLKIR
ncbi:MAG: hypothetical protein JRI80_19555 [Deltaproteobacteria bacterium]|nr:hypothetical protein [Deltaproteobacteria bacterium]